MNYSPLELQVYVGGTDVENQLHDKTQVQYWEVGCFRPHFNLDFLKHRFIYYAYNFLYSEFNGLSKCLGLNSIYI